MRTRADHLEFCKKRAREFLAKGDVVNAIASIMSDLNHHPETAVIVNRDLAALCLRAAADRDINTARRIIEGFR